MRWYEERMSMSDGRETRTPENQRPRKPLIIGLGASASARDSVERFFSRLSLADDQAIVLVTQHREGLDEDWLRAQIQPLDGLKLAPATDGAEVEGKTVYLCPANMIITLLGDRFAVRAAEQAPGERATIDSFLVSLAEDRAEQSIGVVLAGTGGDGTLGVATLKDHGGLAIAERLAGEGEHHLTDSNAAVAIADFVLPAEDIPEHIQVYARHLRRLEEKQDFDEVLAAASASLTRIADILRNQTGNDFHGYKQNTFLRRVQRRMQVVQIDDICAYVEFLRNDKDEAQNLFNDLLIGVTEFFRDKREFEVLETDVIPKIFEGKSAGQQVRVWVLGCATGEEAYSIAILAAEQAASAASPYRVRVFATDLDEDALALARAGVYPESIALDVSPDRPARFFTRDDRRYIVNKAIREAVVFAVQNVIGDPPFSNLDVVSCRNVLIYFEPSMQEKLLAAFHFGLRP
ncbi:MAG TPA: CheR family methyltransferase, partial [Acetobacteraceae bacterium]|nr:CheR family methyltransferase [Acetobacteraceae bacterium]